MVQSHIQNAAAELRAGGLVAFPTETVYGLGALALNATAVRQVFQLKGRPPHNPLIVHVSGIEMAQMVVSAWPAEAETLARAFWPGPLSLVLPRAEPVPPEVTGAGPTVCVRRPDHPITQALLELVGEPLVGPSANRSGQISPTTAAHVHASFPHLTVLDGGPCRVGIESTVVRLRKGGAEILRPGVLGPDEIARLVPVLTPSPQHPPHASMPSPGMLTRHYAPATPTRVVNPQDPVDLSDAAVLAQPTHHAPGARLRIDMPADATAYAAVLYDALRRADAAGTSQIVILAPAGPGPKAAWTAIRDRIARASAAQDAPEPRPRP